MTLMLSGLTWYREYLICGRDGVTGAISGSISSFRYMRLLVLPYRFIMIAWEHQVLWLAPKPGEDWSARADVSGFL